MRVPPSSAWRASRALFSKLSVGLSALAITISACGGADNGSAPGGDGATSGEGPEGVEPGADTGAAGGTDTGGQPGGSDTSAPAGEDATAPAGSDVSTGGDDVSTGGDDAGVGTEDVGGASGDDATASGAETGGGLSNCGQEELTMEVGLIPPSILLLLDRSGSMYDRWDTTMASVQQMIDATAGKVHLGMMMFPRQSSCTTVDAPQVPISAAGAGLIYGVMDTAGTGGSTPMGAATEAAKDYLLGFDAPGDVAMVLVADGKPTDSCMQKCSTCDCDDLAGCSMCGGSGASNCNTFTTEATCPRTTSGCKWEGGKCWSYGAGLLECVNREVEIPITELAMNGIRTWIVGFAGGFGQNALLTRLATAGGTVNDAPQPNGFFDAGEGGQLGAILAEIQSQMAACRARVQVPPGFAFPTVKINGATIPRDTSRTNGWDWLAPGELSFFGDACAQAQQAGAEVAVSFLCK
jgi:hypothetical protein